MRRRKPAVLRAAVLLVAGGVFGVLVSGADHGVFPGSAFLSQVVGTVTAWVIVGFSVAWVASGPLRKSILWSTSALWCAVLTYYLSDALFGEYRIATGAAPRFDWTGFLADCGTYAVLSLGVGVGSRVLVALIRRGGIIGFLAQLVVPAYVVHSELDYASAAVYSGDPASIVWTHRIIGGFGAVAVLLIIARAALRLVVERRSGVHA